MPPSTSTPVEPLAPADLARRFRNIISDEFPALRTRLFLSLDFSGSTPFKQSQLPTHRPAGASLSPEDEAGASAEAVHQPWLEPFAHFFTMLDANLREEWDLLYAVAPKPDPKSRDGLHHPRPKYETAAKKDAGETTKARPHFYQGRGDEAIYCLKLTDPLQAVVAVWAFINATERTRRACRERRNWHPLDVKATAWLAQFPSTNSETVMGANYEALLGAESPLPQGSAMAAHYLLPFLFRLEKMPESTRTEKLDELGLPKERKNFLIRLIESVKFAYKDYIGPQHDLGFRLAALSTPRKMMISLDLAQLLAREISPDDGGEAVTEDDTLTGRAPYEKLFPKASSKGAREPTHLDERDFKSRARDHLFFGYDGRKPLKGVRAGLPYPIFFLHAARDDPFYWAEEKVSALTRAEPAAIDTLANAFFKTASRHAESSHDQWLRPALLCDPDETGRDALTRLAQQDPESDRWLLERFDAVQKELLAALQRLLTTPPTDFRQMAAADGRTIHPARPAFRK